MALNNMKEDAKDAVASPAYGEAEDCYPCGLQVSLGTDELEKLGIDDLPEMGEILTLNAKVKVVRISDETGFYGQSRNLGLQITDMEIKEIGKESDEKD